MNEARNKYLNILGVGKYFCLIPFVVTLGLGGGRIGDLFDEMSYNTCVNIFSLRMLLPKHDADVIAGLNSTLLPLNLSANVLIITTLYRRRQWEMRINRLFFGLSLSYTLAALLVQPFVTILFTDNHTEPSCLLEMVTHYSYFLFSNTSSFIFLVIGVDLLIQHKNLIWYKYALTRGRALALLISMAVATHVLSFAYVIATCYGKHAFINAILSLVIFICATRLLTGFMRLRPEADQTDYFTYLQNRQSKTRHHEYQSINITKYFLACAAIGNILFATAEITNTRTLLSLTAEGSFGRNSSLKLDTRLWAVYLLYFSMITLPLNGFFHAILFLYRNRQCMSDLVKTARKACCKSNEKKTANV